MIISTNIEHQKVVDFVNSFKAANKNTVERVRKYDPKLRAWTFEVVKKDENALKFNSDQIKKSKSKKEKEKRQKTNAAKPSKQFIVKNRAGKEFTRPNSALNLNVVRLHDVEKLTFQKIAELYDLSQASVIRTYKKENESTGNTR